MSDNLTERTDAELVELTAGGENRAFDELVRRYRDAVARLFPDPASPRDRALLAFAIGHPWSVGALDTAAALLAPTSRLRQRLLLMAALLETTPAGAAEFLPREPRLAELALRLPAIGLAR